MLPTVSFSNILKSNKIVVSFVLFSQKYCLLPFYYMDVVSYGYLSAIRYECLLALLDVNETPQYFVIHKKFNSSLLKNSFYSMSNLDYVYHPIG